MTPARRQKLVAGLAIIRDVNDADAWAMLTAETRTALIGVGASFVDGNTNTIRLGGVTASCTYDKGEHLLLRWAANARKALAEDDEEVPFVSAFTEVEEEE
jgi:hypothetical protein